MYKKQTDKSYVGIPEFVNNDYVTVRYVSKVEYFISLKLRGINPIRKIQSYQEF